MSFKTFSRKIHEKWGAGSKESIEQFRLMMNLISYCDGTRTLLEIVYLIEEPFWELIPIVEKLVFHGLLVQKDAPITLTAYS